jgi:hypothetical protein
VGWPIFLDLSLVFFSSYLLLCNWSGVGGNITETFCAPILIRSAQQQVQPECAANYAAAWAVSEREMRERLRRERDAREGKEKIDVRVDYDCDMD